MFKSGVCQLRDLHACNLETKRGRRRFVAVTLYPEVGQLKSPERDRLLELILCRFAGTGRIFKRTHGARFAEFDSDLVRWMERFRHEGDTYRIHDVAVSSGVTALDFYRRVADICPVQLDYLASDSTPELRAISQPGQNLTLVLDPVTQEWLQIVRPPFVFHLQRCERDLIYPINGLLRRWFERTSCRRLWARYQAGDPAIRETTISLLHPDCQSLLQNRSNFRFQRYDILQPSSGSYDLVRAMNILNPAYFSQQDLLRAVANIHASLHCGGLFATGSNQGSDSPVQGAIYRRTDRGFELLTQFGAGSPSGKQIAQFRNVETPSRAGGI